MKTRIIVVVLCLICMALPRLSMAADIPENNFKPIKVSEVEKDFLKPDPNLPQEIYAVPERPHFLLGLNQIKNLVLATSTLQMFRKYQSAQMFDMRKFWEHSVGCAVASKVLAETAYLGSPDDMFAGGLLHDVGKLIHAIYLHEEFSAVVSDVEARGLPLFESEKKILGYDHTYTGRELAMRWSLSQGTISMIAHHHLSDGSALLSKEVAAVHIGNSICIAMGLGSGGEKKVPMINEKAWEMLGIELSSLEYIVARIEKLFKESIAILEP